MRQDLIETAIQKLPGDRFEDFANEILRQTEFPGLIPTSRSHDLGKDAKTTWQTLFLNNDQWVCVAASKTSTWKKLQSDCAKNRHSKIDVFVFAIPKEINEDVKSKWEYNVKAEFGWVLEVRDIRYFAPTANRPQFDRLVFDFLQIPPPDGDFPETILSEFQRCTERALRNSNVHIPGIAGSIGRQEIERVEEQLVLGKAVLLTGDAGTGKSGIGYFLAQNAQNKARSTVVLDARQAAHVQDQNGLRQFYSLKGSLPESITRIGQWKGCTVIIDQIDNVIGTPASTVIVDFAIECMGQAGVDIVVISRKREGHEAKLLRKLVDAGFIELNCFQLDTGTSIELLQALGIVEPSDELVQLGQNLLNLEIIAIIRSETPDFCLNGVTDEIDLWNKLLDVIEEREVGSQDMTIAEDLVPMAAKLAREGLNQDDRTFMVNPPLSRSLKRLISWGIILAEDESNRWFRFRHEKLQDFLYSRDAVERRLLPSQLKGEIKEYRTRNIIVWMDQIYRRISPTYHKRFTRELFLGEVDNG